MKFGYDIFTFVYAFENLDSDFNTQYMYSTFSEIIIQSHLYSNLKEKTQNTSLLTRFTSYATPPPRNRVALSKSNSISFENLNHPNTYMYLQT